MVEATQTLLINDFSGGLNLRDAEIALPLNETPRAYNFEIVTQTGLQKINGFENLFEFSFPSHISWDYVDVYTDDDLNYSIVGVSYPNIYLINPVSGAYELIGTGLHSIGEPIGVEANGGYFLVDGANAPRYIYKKTVTTVTWPPVYTNNNNASGNLDESPYATAANPVASTVGFPSVVAFHANRIWLGGDASNPRRLYVSKIGNVSNFSSNNPLDFDIAFFVDMPVVRPTVALKVLSNKNLIVYCDNQIVVVQGINPPGTAYPQPHFSFEVLNSELGCLSKYLVQAKGDNDHYFVSNQGRIFQLSSTDNFQDAKPFGLTHKIFPLLQQYDNEVFKRGRLINFPLKGELQFWFPSKTTKRYPDQALVLSYGDQPSSETWSLIKEFDEDENILKLRSFYLDRVTNELVIVTDKAFLQINKGFNFNGNPIKSIYQLATLDFGQPNNTKQITNITVNARSSSGTTVKVKHTWENGASGSEDVQIPALPNSFWGEAEWGVDIWLSSAGLPIVSKKFTPANPTGKYLKLFIEHTSDSEDLIIDSIVIDFQVIGKE